MTDFAEAEDVALCFACISVVDHLAVANVVSIPKKDHYRVLNIKIQ